MTVTEVYLAGKITKATGSKTCGEVVDEDASIGKPLQRLVSEAIAINTDDKSFLSFNKETGKENDMQNGNKTECAMLGFVLGLGEDYVAIRKDETFFANDETKPYGRDNPQNFPSPPKGRECPPLFPSREIHPSSGFTPRVPARSSSHGAIKSSTQWRSQHDARHLR